MYLNTQISNPNPGLQNLELQHQTPSPIEAKTPKEKKMVSIMGLSMHTIMDLVVAGFSLIIGLGIFAFIASILCTAAFIQNAKDDS